MPCSRFKGGERGLDKQGVIHSLNHGDTQRAVISGGVGFPNTGLMSLYGQAIIIEVCDPSVAEARGQSAFQRGE